MRHLSVDIETYSSIDLKKAGLYRYAQSPDFEIMLFGYAWGDDPARVIDMTKRKWWGPTDIDEFEALMTALRREDVQKHAYNASFEWYCLNQ
jgi:DNA polymerase